MRNKDRILIKEFWEAQSSVKNKKEHQKENATIGYTERMVKVELIQLDCRIYEKMSTPYLILRMLLNKKVKSKEKVSIFFNITQIKI